MILIKDDAISYDDAVIEDLGILLASLARSSGISTDEFIEKIISYIRNITDSGLLDRIINEIIDEVN